MGPVDGESHADLDFQARVVKVTYRRKNDNGNQKWLVQTNQVGYSILPV